MKYLVSSIIYFSSFFNIFSQNYDSLFVEYLKFRNSDSRKNRSSNILAVEEHKKCGFGIAELLLENANKLSEEDQFALRKITERPVTATSIVSPKGYFRVHYDLTGTHAPKYDVMQVAAAFDSAYNFEVNLLGFLPPPKDGAEGGDDKFDVYIQSLGAGSYGETRFSSINNLQYVSFTLIDNSFASVPTSGINGAIVTAAHEFHHAIQVGNYGWNNDQIFFYELTSTSMEEFVFDDINDYYYYLPAYFRKPNNALSSFSGYELALWNIYLVEKFIKSENDYEKGFELIKRTWDIFAESKNSVTAISLALFENGTNFKKEFLEFGLWCYFTGSRADSKYFSEGNNYPKIKPINIYSFSPPQKQYMINTLPVSNNYLYFTKTPASSDTLVTVVSNCDIQNYLFPENQISFNYNLFNYNESGAIKIIDNYYSVIESEKKDLLKEGNIYNYNIVSGQDFHYEVESYAFPQPFSYSMFDNLYIPVFKSENSEAEVKIFSVDMKLVYSNHLQIQSNDKVFVKWNVKDSNGNNLPTGVYLYLTKSGDKTTKGKFAIYND